MVATPRLNMHKREIWSLAQNNMNEVIGMDLTLTSFSIWLFVIVIICPIIFALAVTRIIKQTNSESVKLLKEIRDLLKQNRG